MFANERITENLIPAFVVGRQASPPSIRSASPLGTGIARDWRLSLRSTRKTAEGCWKQQSEILTQVHVACDAVALNRSFLRSEDEKWCSIWAALIPKFGLVIFVLSSSSANSKSCMCMQC